MKQLLALLAVAALSMGSVSQASAATTWHHELHQSFYHLHHGVHLALRSVHHHVRHGLHEIHEHM